MIEHSPNTAVLGKSATANLVHQPSFDLIGIALTPADNENGKNKQREHQNGLAEEKPKKRAPKLLIEILVEIVKFCHFD